MIKGQNKDQNKSQNISQNISQKVQEEIRRISGSNDKNCMKCGKCSASCPAYNDMDIRPHQFVSNLQSGDINNLLESSSIWACLGCFTCVQRCPRDVKPSGIIEAVRLTVIRRQNENRINPEDIPKLLDPEIPQQLIVSVFRKYAK